MVKSLTANMKSLSPETAVLIIAAIVLCIVHALQTHNRKSKIKLRLQNHEVGTLETYKKKTKALMFLANTHTTFVRGDSNHTYRHNRYEKGVKMPMKHLNRILSFEGDMLEVEANVKLETCIRFLLSQGYNLVCCPDLKDLTLGGIVSGIGGGNTSFRHGYFHNSILEMDILLPGGDLLTVTPEDDLFRAIPGTMGTLGYVTRMKIRCRKASPFVQAYVHHFSTPETYFACLKTYREYRENHDWEFVDGVVFSSTFFVVVTGRYIDALPSTDHTLCNVVNQDVYYKVIKRKEQTLYFDTYEFIYRFSTDLYFTSMSLPFVFREPLFRSCFPKSFVPTVQNLLAKAFPVDISALCQDVLIPEKNALSFFQWYDLTIGLYPLYNVVVQSPVQTATFWRDTDAFVDFGIAYGVLPVPRSVSYQKQLCLWIENEMLRLNGVKLPYTSTFVKERMFWERFGRSAESSGEYLRLRKRFHAESFPSVYEKVGKM